MSELQGDTGANYMAYRDSVQGDAALADFKKEMGLGQPAQPTQSTESTQPPEQTQQPKPSASNFGRDYFFGGPVLAIARNATGRAAVKDVGLGLTRDLARSVYTGARDAVTNTYDTIDDFGKWAEKKFGQATGFYGLKVDSSGVHAQSASDVGDGLGGLVTGGKGTTPQVGDAVRDFMDTKHIADPKTVTGGLVKGVSQFLTGLALTRRAFVGAGLPAEVSGAGSYAYSALKGAVTNFAAFDPHQNRLSNLVEKFPQLSNPVTQYLQSKPGDSEAEGRFKNALEGLGIGALSDGLMKGVKMLRGIADANAVPLEPEQAKPGADVGAFNTLGDETSDKLVSNAPFTGPPAPNAPVGQKTPLGNYLRQQHAEVATSTVEPTDITGAVRPEPQKTYINFARIDTPEDIKDVMSKLADRFSPSVEAARRGTQTFEEIKLNSHMENAWDLLQNRRVGEPLNAEQSVAARELWATSAEKLKELAQTAATAPTDANLFAFRKMMATHYAIQQSVIGARTETARALASWRIPVGSAESRLQDITDRMMNLSGGKDQVQQMARYVTALSSVKEYPHELEQFIEKSAYARTRDGLIQAFSDGLLSSPVTQAKILASNVSTGIWRIGERAWASKISRAIGTPDGVQPGEAGAMWSGWIGSFKDAMAYGYKAMKTGVTGEGIGEPHESYPSNISANALNLSDKPWLGRAADFIGNALSLGRRGIAAQHDVALTMAYRGELNAQAYRQAIDEVNSGALKQGDFPSRVAELMATPPPMMLQAARDGAKYQAFLDEPGKIANWMLEGRRQIPALRVIAPFIKIPARIMSYTFERTPLAPLMSDFRAKVAAGGATRDLALAQVSMGSMIMSAAADMTMSGVLKGGGPPQKGLEQAEEREGKMRDSLKIGNRWFNINGVHPAGKLMLLAADVAEAINGGQQELHDDTDTEHLVAGTSLAIGRTLMDNSYFTGIANLFAALHDGRVGGAGEGAILSTAGSAVPAISGAVARATDPYQREIYSMLDEFKSKIPGLSSTLPPRRNLWGEAIPSGHDPLTNFISPVKIANEKHNPIDDEILKQGFNITMPDRTQTFTPMGGEAVPVNMSQYPGAYSRLLQLAGNELQHPAWNMGAKDLLNAIVSGEHPLSAVYNLKSDGPEGGKEIMIRGLISQYRDYAKKQILDEYPALAQEVQDKSDAKRELKLGVQ